MSLHSFSVSGAQSVVSDPPLSILELDDFSWRVSHIFKPTTPEIAPPPPMTSASGPSRRPLPPPTVRVAGSVLARETPSFPSVLLLPSTDVNTLNSIHISEDDTTAPQHHPPPPPPYESFLPRTRAAIPDWFPQLTGAVERTHQPYIGRDMGQPMIQTLIPEGLGSSDKILCMQYDDAPRMMATRPNYHPLLKMGGVNMDVSPHAIHNLLQSLSGVAIDFVEMFSVHQGRCTVFFSNPADAETLRSAIDHKVWMAPHCAVVATSSLSINFLTAYVDRVKKMVRRSQTFPRHLTTMERWEVAPVNSRRARRDEPPTQLREAPPPYSCLVPAPESVVEVSTTITGTPESEVAIAPITEQNETHDWHHEC